MTPRGTGSLRANDRPPRPSCRTIAGIELHRDLRVHSSVRPAVRCRGGRSFARRLPVPRGVIVERPQNRFESLTMLVRITLTKGGQASPGLAQPLLMLRWCLVQDEAGRND